jgi:hypothetical protein
MAHYAFIDDNYIVTEVIVGRDEDEVVNGISDWEKHYEEVRGQRCLRTSYNTLGNKHSKGETPFRGNFAAVGYIYDKDFDVFYPQKPYPSWKMDYETYLWEAPIPMPEINPDDEFVWKWSEVNQEWIKINL